MPIMKHTITPALPCTTYKSTPQMTFQCCTITQPANSNVNLNLEYYQAPKKWEHLFLDSGGNYTTSSSSCIMPISPVSLGNRWMDYQGMKNWEGLLDPLDDNLRGEIIRYGHFVETAYRSFDFDPSSSSYAKCLYSQRKLFHRSGFSKTGYRVTKNLSATSGIQMPRWMESAPSWMARQSSWIGYVAICHDKREIERLGRRDVVIALRGTATCLEWIENLRATLAPMPRESANSSSHSSPMVESGFLSLYTSKLANRPSLQNLVRKEIARILEMYGHEPLSITITGHSLGAALATLTAFDIKETFENAPLVTVVSFGGPRVGNRSFRCHLEKQGTKILRIVNSNDLITKVPGFVVDQNDKITNNQDHYMASFSTWIQKRMEDTQWVYADVGCELRLSSKESPDLNGIDIATCHELKTYLHLVNGFGSSNCPIRATARKMIHESQV